MLPTSIPSQAYSYTLDSHFIGTPFAITVAGAGGPRPNIVIDNLLIEGNTPSVVLVDGGETLLPGTSGPPLVVGNWGSGTRYQSTSGLSTTVTGYVTPAPVRPSALVDGNGKWFTRSRPLYETLSASSFVVATANGVSNANQGDQAAAINALLSAHVGTPIFFPAGIYLIGSTIQVPVGSIIVGEAWSQFMAFGATFSDPQNPQVLFR